MRKLLTVIGIVLTFVGLGWYFIAPVLQAPEPTSPQSVVASSHGPSYSSSPTPTPTMSPSAASVLPTEITAPPPAVQPAEGAVPAWLSVPAIGIDESLIAMGLNAAGVIEPPQGQTIWYDQSPKPGSAGISVIAGHVQWSKTPDNFWRLSELANGSLFSVRYTDGTVIEFIVTASRSELKTDAQSDPAIWGESDTPVVVLVTCDKDLKRSPVINGHHTNNWFVFAKPVS